MLVFWVLALVSMQLEQRKSNFTPGPYSGWTLEDPKKALILANVAKTAVKSVALLLVANMRVSEETSDGRRRRAKSGEVALTHLPLQKLARRCSKRTPCR